MDRSLHPKAIAHRKRMEQFKADLAAFALIAPEWEKRREQQLYDRRRDAGLIFDDPPADAVAFWFDPKLGRMAIDHKIGRWVNAVQMAGLLRRGMSPEFLMSITAIRLTPHQPDAAITPAGEEPEPPAAQVMFNG